MNIPNETLDAWRVSLDQVRAQINAAKFAAPGILLQQHLRDADDAARRLALALEQAGAIRPGESVSAADVPLHLMNTPANRRYADALRFAWECSLAVDRERYGEGIGTDGCAQVIELVLQEVEAELHGPAVRE